MKLDRKQAAEVAEKLLADSYRYRKESISVAGDLVQAIAELEIAEKVNVQMLRRLRELVAEHKSKGSVMASTILAALEIAFKLSPKTVLEGPPHVTTAPLGGGVSAGTPTPEGQSGEPTETRAFR